MKRVRFVPKWYFPLGRRRHAGSCITILLESINHPTLVHSFQYCWWIFHERNCTFTDIQLCQPPPTPLITSTRTEEHLPSGQGLTRVLKLTASLLLYVTSNVIRIRNFVLHLHICTSRSDLLTAFHVEFVIIMDDNSGVISGLACFCWVYSHKS